jgi:hypothetical protein
VLPEKISTALANALNARTSNGRCLRNAALQKTGAIDGAIHYNWNLAGS